MKWFSWWVIVKIVVHFVANIVYFVGNRVQFVRSFKIIQNFKSCFNLIPLLLRPLFPNAGRKTQIILTDFAERCPIVVSECIGGETTLNHMVKVQIIELVK
ncbi:hypothetical protein C492_19434 [Natronococcus jeotgali DSM 18795]|uniref:Uncharacterized protein n=1 Tax=Natronococcus jeotgali DSM 18795 TaxID=1227498 RepID=L9WSC9_9EURY|nr:hypothetical protein C492_19434 [Natronococcus jeotgali DSM 18795]